MIRHTALSGWKFVALLVALVALASTVEQRRVTSLRQQAAAAMLAAANFAAERDTPRNPGARDARLSALLADSLRVVEKLVVQQTQRSDAVDRALNRERRPRYQVGVSVDSLREMVAAAKTEPAATIARADFEVRRPAFTISAEGEIPPHPDSARMDIRLALDPIPVDARVSCEAPNDLGIRAADVATVSPPWAEVRFGRLQQSPELCASPAPTPTQPTREHLPPRLVVGVGRSFGLDGRAAWAWFLGAGIISWN
jgi:hypothetical protein